MSLDICKQLIEKSRLFLETILIEGDSDENLAAFNAFLDEREPLLDVLNQQDKSEYQDQMQILYEIDQQIREALMGWIAETKIELETMNRQRDAYLKIKRAQGGYNKQQPYSEGYFIDKKK